MFKKNIFAGLIMLLSLLGSAKDFTLSDQTSATLSKYCYDCHDEDVQKGDVRFDNLGALKLDDRLEMMNKIQEQMYFGHMPPKKKKQPSEAQRNYVVDWLAKELKKSNAYKLAGKLQKPEYGNYVDHEKLFSGEYKDLQGFTYDRRWLISEFIFNAKFQRIMQVSERAKYKSKLVTVKGGSNIRELSLTNPFLLPETIGVRYYANTDLTGGHLSTMLTNAQKSAEYISAYLVKRNKKYMPAINEIMALEDKHNATLAARKEFLENFIAKVCEDLYGSKNKSLLPEFKPVKINALKKLEKGEKYKKAPIHVATNQLKGLEADTMVFRLLQHQEYGKMSNKDFSQLCEKIWFYNGDHERKIQGRMTLLRDYLDDYRKQLAKQKKRYKPLHYKPLGNSEMEAVKSAISKHRIKGDFYTEIITKCIADWTEQFKRERIAAGPPQDELLNKLIDQLFVKVLERAPTAIEVKDYLIQSKSYIAKLGKLKGIQKLIQTVILNSEFVYRQEFGTGKVDSYGRRMLSPRDAAYALAYALTDQSPDEELVQAVESGKLNTREDYKREILRMLKKRDEYYLIDPVLAGKRYQWNTTNLAIRKLRFFREFFGYPKALKIFKDEKRFGGERLSNATNRLINEADRLIEHILKNDKNVFEELLTTEKFYVYHDGDNDRMQAASDRIKSIYNEFKDVDWKNYKKEDLLKHKDFLKKVKMRSVDPDKLDAKNRQGNTIKLFKMSLTSITERLNKGQKEAAPFDLYRGYGNDFMSGFNVARFFSIKLNNWDYATVQPAKVEHRKGMLTHPAWLIAHAQNTETDPVIRGKWIREKLLAGTIPEVPITVDAVIPEDHSKTLRDRLDKVTMNDYCWKCHDKMNPLGYAFESYDDFGRFRTEESLEYQQNLIKEGPKKAYFFHDTNDIYKTAKVDTTGALSGTGDKSLDGPVKNALELAEKLGKSSRVRQSIIRHAFRYFMGRNEVLSDSKALIDADLAYLKSGGSFDAVIVSLLTSDSFIYRKALQE